MKSGAPLPLERAVAAGHNLAQAVPDEVRLHLARGLDPVWKSPCTEHGTCHHALGWRIVAEAMRPCVLGPWDPDLGGLGVLALDEPFIESLSRVADDAIRVSRIDAAIRGLAPAVTANICVSMRAHGLLMVLLAAQRRGLIAYPHDGDPDPRGVATRSWLHAPYLLLPRMTIMRRSTTTSLPMPITLGSLSTCFEHSPPQLRRTQSGH